MSQQSYRDRLRASTLMVAQRIVATEGLPALQARRVAQEAGCSVGTIYNLYDGLDELIISVNAATLEDLGKKLADEIAASAGADMSTRLTKLALAYLHFAVNSQAAWRSVFEHQLAKDKFVPDWYRERQAGLFAILESVLREVVSDDEQCAMAARALFSAVHGITAIALDQKLGEFEKSATEDQIRFVVGAAARGLRDANR